MPPEHYFTADPSSPANWREISVTLAGTDLVLTSAAGLFSPDGLDRATAILLDRVPPPPAQGNLLDLGSGWGPVAVSLALQSPEAEVWAVDVNHRALEATRRNAERAGAARIHPVTPESVPDDIQFAAIWSNPPIRIGKPALHAMLEQWLPRLAPGATAWLVVGRQLGADSLQRWIAERLGDEYEVERAATAKGFRILTVHRHGSAGVLLSEPHNHRIRHRS